LVDRQEKEDFAIDKYQKKKYLLQDNLIDQSKWDLSQILRLELGRKYLRKFLEMEYSAENISFWESVDEFKLLDQQPPDVVREKAREIFRRFLNPKSSEMINVPDQLVKEIAPRIETEQSVSLDIFDKAQKSIFHVSDL
jgi:hypothetical protein